MTYHLALDLETTSLYADEGIITCYALVGQDGSTFVRAIKEPEEEPELLAQLIKDLWTLNLRHPTLRIITYNGSAFDFPMLITRFLNLKMLDQLARFKKNFDSKAKHLDLYFIMRNNILIKSKKLSDVCKYFGVEYNLGDKNALELWKAKELDKLKEYCLTHAKLLHKLRKKLIAANILERD